jgi:hypothetical protein
MSQFVETRNRTFISGGVLEPYRLVRLSTGKLAYNGDANTDWLGSTLVKTPAADLLTDVTLRNAEGTIILTAAGSIAAGVSVYAAADGKVDDTGTVLIGQALQAAGADGDWIEVLPSTNTAFGTVPRTNLTQEDLVAYPLPLDAFRTHDALQTVLPGTASADDLGLSTGTLGTSSPVLQTVDFGGTTTTAYGRIRFAVPAEYVAGQTITLRLNAGMLTTISDGTATIDAQVYRAAAPTVDVCATAATTINSLTASNKDFTITPTNVVPGDILDIRVAIAGSDTGDAGVMRGQIYSADLLLDIKG